MPFFDKTLIVRNSEASDTMKWLIGIGTLTWHVGGGHRPADRASRTWTLKEIGNAEGNGRSSVAINQRQGRRRRHRSPSTSKSRSQFNQISPENLLKFQPVHPAADRYAFEAQDRYVQFGLDRKMQVVGHTLVWHQQTPAWVFQGADGTPADRDTPLLACMRDHIHTVVGRYKGKIHVGTSSTRRSTKTARCARRRGATGLATTTSPGRSSSRVRPTRTPSSTTTTTTSKRPRRAGVVRLVKDLRARRPARRRHRQPGALAAIKTPDDCRD